MRQTWQLPKQPTTLSARSCLAVRRCKPSFDMCLFVQNKIQQGHWAGNENPHVIGGGSSKPFCQ
jgi:hypothetical protein